MLSALDFLIDLSSHAVTNIHNYVRAGHNGPYFHPETEVRNKGHWLFTLSRVYRWTGVDRFKTAAEPLAEYLLSADARPHNQSFFHRNVKGKDQANGLVGQAWTLESLAEASSLFQDTNFLHIAKEVFFQHNFLEEYGLWNILEVNGRHKAIDYAFNHQLWFAAAASTLKDEIVNQKVDLFLKMLFENVTLLESGLIYHELENTYNDPFEYQAGVKDRVKRAILNTFYTIGLKNKPKKKFASLEEKKKLMWEKMKHKSIGYHAFNTYAFAILKENLPDHLFWENNEFQAITDYLLTTEYKTGVVDNKYSFAYNPPGFEVPYSLEKLSDMEDSRLMDTSAYWLNRQIEITYDAQNKIFSRNTKDPLTLTARIYELCRLSPDILNGMQIKI